MKTTIVIISGMSGSGKASALKAFEDLGYFCVDNLPIELIPTFVDLCIRSEENLPKAALVVDARERRFLGEFPAIFTNLRQRPIDLKMIFLDTSDEALVRRFSETRRPHPLSVEKGGLAEAIRAERQLLEPLRSFADLIVDTTGHTVHSLRALLVEEFRSEHSPEMVIDLISFGFKYGVPTGINLLFDVRYLTNPHFVPELRPLTGRHPAIVKYLEDFPEVEESLSHFVDLLLFLIPRYQREGRSYLTIGVGCTGGRHRSVMIAESLKRRLRKMGHKARVINRDMDKE